MHASLPRSPRAKFKPCPFSVVHTLGHVGTGSSCLGPKARYCNLQRSNLQENVFMKILVDMRTFDPHDVYGQRTKKSVLAPLWQPLAVKGDKVCVGVYFTSFPETAFDVELRKTSPHVFDTPISLRIARENKIIEAMWALAKVYGRVKHVELKAPHVSSYNRRAGLVFYEYMEEAEMLCFDLNKRNITTYDMHGNIDETVTMYGKLNTNRYCIPKESWWKNKSHFEVSETPVTDAIPYTEGITGDLPTLRPEERELVRLTERLKKHESEAEQRLLSTVKKNSKKDELKINLDSAMSEMKELEFVVQKEEAANTGWMTSQGGKKGKKGKKMPVASTPTTTELGAREKLTLASEAVRHLKVEIDDIHKDADNYSWPDIRGKFTSDLPLILSPIAIPKDDKDEIEKKANADAKVQMILEEQKSKRAEVPETMENAFFEKNHIDIADNDETTTYELRRLCRRLITS